MVGAPTVSICLNFQFTFSQSARGGQIKKLVIISSFPFRRKLLADGKRRFHIMKETVVEYP
jgi:hypothetical protein